MRLNCWYNPQLNQWHQIDPLAENYYALSSYNYVANNPIKYIDPDGRWVSEFDDMQAPGGENPPEVPGCPECDPGSMLQEVLVTAYRPFMKEDIESITTLFRALGEAKEREQAQYEANLAHKATGSCTLANDELNLIPYEKLAAGIFSISKAAAIIVTGIKWGKPVGKVTYAGAKVVSKSSTRFIDTYNGLVDLCPTLERIAKGIKYPHRNDGSVFKNLQKLLPSKPMGYYTEYVVPTPGVSHAGLQRIIKGTNGEIWFTPDHYTTFIPINP